MTLARSTPGMTRVRTPRQSLGPLHAMMSQGLISPDALRKFLSTTSNTPDDPHGALQTFDEAGMGQGMRQPKQNLGMGGGHINDPINTKGRMPFAPEGRGQSDYGPADAYKRSHVDSRANKRMYPHGTHIGNERTVLDKSVRAKTARVHRGSAHEYYSDAWYGHPASRQER